VSSSGGTIIAVPLEACIPLVYTAPVTIGSQTFQLNVDTGSTSLGVASTMCGTSCGVSPEYTPGASAVDDKQMATSQYGTGSWTGEIYTDSVGFASDPSIPLNFVAIDSQSMFFTPGIQCGTSGQGYQGIIGFDRASAELAGTNAFFDQFVTAKGIANVFATELCDASGTLWLGGYDPTAASAPPLYTPVTTDVASTYYYTVDLETVTVAGVTTPIQIAGGQYPDTVVDTGTSGFVVPTQAFNSLASAIAGTSGFQQAFGASAGAAWFSSQQPCGAAGMTKAQIDATLPALTLTFGTAPGMTLQLPPSESYLISYGSYGWCSTMIQIPSGQQFPLAAIMGAPFMRSMITIYDRANNQIGFAPHAPCP
jgi:hypothetical protein